ncbi:hypothetical protein RND81_14G243700 [Saponaria officinalis]|uniref:Uncharacterized protein n=1 Tax=Saponaria officinalis TaxID=3572 RepID=A0AAW1GW17_SAPOF
MTWRRIIRRCPPRVRILIARIIRVGIIRIRIFIPHASTHANRMPLIRVIGLLPTSTPPCWRRFWFRPYSPRWIPRRGQIIHIPACGDGYGACSLVPPWWEMQ